MEFDEDSSDDEFISLDMDCISVLADTDTGKFDEDASDDATSQADFQGCYG